MNNRGSYGYNTRCNQRYGEIVITEEVITGIKVMIEIEVDHMKGRVEIGEIIEVWVTAGPGQVLEHVKTAIELDVFNVENMTIC